MMNQLNPRQKRHLRTLAHKLKPVVIVGGSGLSEAVINEIQQSIQHHELIKVRVNAADRQSRMEMIQTISEATDSAVVFCIGHIVTLYRASKKPRISLPS